MQRSNGGGAFQAVDTLNGKLLCGCSDVHACVVRVHVHELVSSSYISFQVPLQRSSVGCPKVFKLFHKRKKDTHILKAKLFL